MSPAAETLSNRTARAAHWRFAGTVISGTSHLVVAVFLARLLSPAEFGIVALAQFALGLAQTVCDLGIGAAVVQRSQLSERHVRVAVTSSALVGLAAAAIVAGGAGVGAAVMREPGVAPVLRVLALGLAFRSVAVVADALLRRQLDFRRLFFIETASYVFGYGCVAITLAALDSGVWSLVWASLVQTALASGAQWASVRHSVRPLLARRELAELLRFGVGSALARLANYFALNGDNLVVGRWMGAANLGLYDRAYILMKLPNTYVAAVISGALFPALSQVQEQPSRLRRGYFLATRVTAMIAGPAMATVIVGAPYLVSSLYGHQWTAMVIPLQILCLAGYFRALYHLGVAVAQSVGRVYSDLWRQTVYAALVIGGALAARRFGLPGVSVAVAAAIVFMFVATGQLALQATGGGWIPYLRVQLPAVVASGITAALALSARLLLESQGTPAGIITLAILAAAAVPWSLGLLWALSEPELAAVLTPLPSWCLRLVGAVRRFRQRERLR